MSIFTLSKSCSIINGTINLLGTQTSIRSTIIKDNSNVTIISPINFTDEHLDFIRNQGNVKTIIAPNVFHHLYLQKTFKHFPEAEVLIPKGLEKKVNLKYQFLDDNIMSFNKSLEIVQLKGAKKLNEFIFFHKKDKTLITTDLFFNIQKCRNIYEKIIWSLLGVYKNCTHSRVFKFLVDNKEEFIQCKKTLQLLGAQNLILAHGEIILNDYDKIKECLKV